MRENWQSRKGFIFAAAGAAIGLGNLWRFPFQVKGA
jgi:NSS family neurotransmitter:Na+ symporter